MSRYSVILCEFSLRSLCPSIFSCNNHQSTIVTGLKSTEKGQLSLGNSSKLTLLHNKATLNLSLSLRITHTLIPINRIKSGLVVKASLYLGNHRQLAILNESLVFNYYLVLLGNNQTNQSQIVCVCMPVGLLGFTVY